MIIDLKKIAKLKELHYVNVTQHHEFPDIFLANYSKRAATDREIWDTEPLINHCRGLVYDKTGKVLAKPFKKFWNAGELRSLGWEDLLDQYTPEVTTKMDGSLGVLLHTGPFTENPTFCTRGSFTSEQAVKATEIWNSKYKDRAVLNGRLTYLFEIIYPSNRIIVDYGPLEDLVLIGVIDTASGHEYGYNYIRGQAHRLRVPVTDSWNFKKTILTAPKEGFEGYVLFLVQKQLRVKVKLEEYVRTHRAKYLLSEKYILEILFDYDRFKLLMETIPSEYVKWANEMRIKLLKGYATMESQAVVVGIHARALSPNRKEQAHYIATHLVRSLQGVAFSFLDGKKYQHILLKLLEPKGLGRIPFVASEDT